MYNNKIWVFGFQRDVMEKRAALFHNITETPKSLKSPDKEGSKEKASSKDGK
jgi:hypothetical protein